MITPTILIDVGLLPKRENRNMEEAKKGERSNVENQIRMRNRKKMEINKKEVERNRRSKRKRERGEREIANLMKDRKISMEQSWQGLPSDDND